MKTIGLTGGIASGKSTVAQMMREEKIPVLDADVYARRALDPDEDAYHDVVAYFGDDILFQDGSVDRKKLGAIVFDDEEKRNVLNGIVHPFVRAKMDEEKEVCRSQGYRAVVLDIPLLIEGGLTGNVDEVLLVYVDFTTQLARLKGRDHSTEADALSRIRAQLPLEEKKQHADAVIDNGGTKAETRQQLAGILQKWEIH